MSTPQSEPKDVYEEVIIPDLQYAIENMKEQAYTSSGGDSRSRTRYTAGCTGFAWQSLFDYGWFSFV